MFKELNVLYKKILKPFVLWAKESWFRALVFVIFIYIAFIPFLNYLRQLVESAPYRDYFLSTIHFFENNLRLIDYVFFGISLLFFCCLFYLARQLQRTRVVREKFDRDLNRWSIPIESAWTIQECEDAPGKMLSVTNSSKPGTLKEIYTWFDYEINFLFKIKDDALKDTGKSFSILIRAENNSNGILIQITTEEFRPHIVYNDVYIQDNDNFKRLPTVLKTDVWYPAKIIVQGTSVDIWIEKYKLQQYRIKTKSLLVEDDLLRYKKRNVTFKNIEESDSKIRRVIQEWFDSIDKLRDEKDREKKKELAEKREEAFGKVREIDYSRITFEYQKGSIGFRSIDKEQSYFRELVVKKI